MNNENMMRYLLATMEEVAKGHFTPKVAAREVMAAILGREKDTANYDIGSVVWQAKNRLGGRTESVESA